MKTTGELIVREMTLDDIPHVLSIQSETGLSFWSETDYSREIGQTDSIGLSAEVDSVVAGFIVIRLLAGDGNDFREAEILNFAVSKKFQRNGVGSRIFYEATRQLKELKIDELWLEVRESNFSAINFYRRHGFEPMSTRRNYFTDPTENAIIMRSYVK